MRKLQHYAWPGNIRELRNVVERAMILATGPRVSIPMPRPTVLAALPSTKIDDVMRDHIRAVLESCGWRVRGESGAAERLGVRPTTLETRMAKLGIVRPRWGSPIHAPGLERKPWTLSSHISSGLEQPQDPPAIQRHSAAI
jgi:transcriptional regulator with GAF, ATPase, and Fis domain